VEKEINYLALGFAFLGLDQRRALRREEAPSKEVVFSLEVEGAGFRDCQGDEGFRTEPGVVDIALLHIPAGRNVNGDDGQLGLAQHFEH